MDLTAGTYRISATSDDGIRVYVDDRLVTEWPHSDQVGDYIFSGGGNQYVSLADIIYEPYLSSIIAFDAIKWVRLN